MARKPKSKDRYQHLESFLEETLEAWRDVRSGIISEVENIPEDKFDFRPTPEMRSVRELIWHILEVSMMMTGELTRPDTNMKRMPWPDLLRICRRLSGEKQRNCSTFWLHRWMMPNGNSCCRRSCTWQFMERFDGLPERRSSGFTTESPRRCTIEDSSRFMPG